jgi:hypothetical protein
MTPETREARDMHQGSGPREPRDEPSGLPGARAAVLLSGSNAKLLRMLLTAAEAERTEAARRAQEARKRKRARRRRKTSRPGSGA